MGIAKNLTGSKTEDEAIRKIKSKLSASNQFHGPKKFPEVESNATAYARCKDEISARKYCPIRWKSMEKWKNVSQSFSKRFNTETKTNEENNV